MLYVNGINKIVKNDGIAISDLSHSISLSDEHINDPTIISAGAVLRDVALLRNVKRKSGSISMGLLFRQLVNWRMFLMARE